MHRALPWLIVLAAAGLVAAQPTVLNPDPNGPRPIDAADTLFIEEAAEAVPWTKPDELVYQPGLPLPRLGDHFSSGPLVTFVDGSVRPFPKDTTEAALRDAILRTR